MTTVTSVLPREVEDWLVAMITAGKPGSVELHLSVDGIESWKLIEAGRIKRNTG